MLKKVICTHDGRWICPQTNQVVEGPKFLEECEVISTQVEPITKSQVYYLKGHTRPVFAIFFVDSIECDDAVEQLKAFL